MPDLNAVFGCLTAVVCASGPGIPALDPKPRKVDILAGEYGPRPDLTIKAAGTDIPAAKRAAQTLARDLRKHGFKPSVTDIIESKADITISITDDLSFGEHGYRLMVQDKITIVAATDEGLLCGGRMLLQLFSAGPNAQIRRVRIEDEPEVATQT